jgi:hypothetical protein
MKQIPYVKDPEYRTSHRCFSLSGDGVTSCTRIRGHSSDTVVFIKDDDDKEIGIQFNHRGMKNGFWYAW